MTPCLIFLKVLILTLWFALLWETPDKLFFKKCNEAFGDTNFLYFCKMLILFLCTHRQVKENLKYFYPLKFGDLQFQVSYGDIAFYTFPLWVCIFILSLKRLRANNLNIFYTEGFLLLFFYYCGSNVLQFYLIFEVILIPIYLIVGTWENTYEEYWFFLFIFYFLVYFSSTYFFDTFDVFLNVDFLSTYNLSWDK